MVKTTKLVQFHFWYNINIVNNNDASRKFNRRNSKRNKTVFRFYHFSRIA